MQVTCQSAVVLVTVFRSCSSLTTAHVCESSPTHPLTHHSLLLVPGKAKARAPVGRHSLSSPSPVLLPRPPRSCSWPCFVKSPLSPRDCGRGGNDNHPYPLPRRPQRQHAPCSTHLLDAAAGLGQQARRGVVSPPCQSFSPPFISKCPLHLSTILLL